MTYKPTTDDQPTDDDMQEQFVAGAMVTGFAYSLSEAREDWAAWLAAHDAEVAADALRCAASAPIPCAALNTRSNGLRQWLRARADQIERGE